jgi:hypothetical protein
MAKTTGKSSGNRYAVMPHQDGGWQVKRDGGDRATHRTDTKAEAEAVAREISRNQDAELRIYRRDGSIERSDIRSGVTVGRNATTGRFVYAPVTKPSRALRADKGQVVRNVANGHSASNRRSRGVVAPVSHEKK